MMFTSSKRKIRLWLWFIRGGFGRLKGISPVKKTNKHRYASRLDPRKIRKSKPAFTIMYCTVQYSPLGLLHSTLIVSADAGIDPKTVTCSHWPSELQTTGPHLIHIRVHLIHIRLHLIHTRLYLIHTYRLHLIHIRMHLIHTRLYLTSTLGYIIHH